MGGTTPKSTVELVMERLRQKDAEAGVETVLLTDAQKNVIAEARRTYDAKSAECRILYDSAVVTVLAPDTRAELDANYRRDLARFASDRDRKIEAVRKGRL